MCREALLHADVVELFHTESQAELLELAIGRTRVTTVSDEVMMRLSDASTPQGVIAVVRTPSLDGPIPALGPLLVLDSVGEPGNVGTLVRTAAAFGVPVVSIDGADPFGPKAVRASAGSCYLTPIHRRRGTDVTNAELRGDGRLLFGLAADGGTLLADAVNELTTRDAVLMLGSEPRGLAASAQHSLDRLLRIPMAPNVESLNVAAAGAIALHALMSE